MTTPYDRLFGLRSLNGMVLAFADEQNLNTLFQDLFARGRRMEPDGETVEWDEVQLHRHLAPVVGRDAPFPLVEHTTKLNRQSALCHIKLSKRIAASKLYSERVPGELRPDASLVVDLELRDLVKLMKNSIEFLAVHTLDGLLTVDPTTIPGSQVTFTVAYAPNTYAATTSWADPKTKVLSVEINALKQDFLQTSGLLPRRVIMGATVQGFIAQNPEIQTLLQYQFGREIAASAANLFGQALEGFPLGGLQWAVNEAGYVPQAGAFTRFIPKASKLYVLPDDSQLSNVLAFALGRGFVPGNDTGPAEAAAELVRLAPQRGFYSYAVRTLNPPGVEIFVGWVGLPLLLFPPGVLVGDAAP